MTLTPTKQNNPPSCIFSCEWGIIYFMLIFHFACDIFFRNALLASGCHLRRAAGYDAAAFGAAFRAHVNQVIRIDDHIQIMLDDNHGGTGCHQTVEDLQEHLHI